GIGKMNPAFSLYLRNKMVVSGLHVSSSTVYEWIIYHTGYFLGIIEILLSIGLFFPRIKKVSALFLIVMHLLILAALGPFGINRERIVWPWNIAMILTLYVFFLRNSPVSLSLQSVREGW